MIRRIPRTERDRKELETLQIDVRDMEDDHYDYSKVVVKKPWGYEYLIFSNDTIAVWILYLKAGAQTSMHCHPNKKTSLVVLEGEVTCSTITESLVRTAGEGLLIDKGVFHQTAANLDDGAFVMEIETPVNKRDLARLTDKYGREGKGYETEAQHSFNTQNYNYISFHSRGIQHNLKKRFGHCSLTFKHVAGGKLSDEIRELNPEDVICVLEGQLHDASGQPVTDVGDTTTVRALQPLAGLRASQNAELLIIKRIDRVLKISDFVASFLRASGIEPVFIVPGEANVHLLDSIGRHEGISFVSTQSEKSASLAAESFAKLRSDLSAVVVSSGAAAANTIPGVANAWVDSVPMLVISGQARADQDMDGRVRQFGNKALNVVDLVRTITKYAVKVTDPTSIRYHLEKAAFLATHGRPGPVWIDLPIDIQGMLVDEAELKPFDPGEEVSAATLSDEDLRRRLGDVLAMLARASRPVILAGSGIRSAKASAQFLELIDRLRIPVLTSRRGADLVPDDHPYFFGRPNTYGQRSANFVIQNCDLLIAIGSRLSVPLIGRNSGAFARAARKVVVDIDPGELDKPTLKPDLPVPADAGRFIRELLSQLPADLPSYSQWVDRCRQWRRTFPPDSYSGPSLPPDPPSDGPIYPLPLIRFLAAQLTENEVIVADGGATMIYTLLAFRFKSGQRLISSTGLELPGFAVAGSIGASVANDRKRVICLCEDRGFQLSIQDLHTILEYRLPVRILILKSRGHSIIRNIQRDYFGGRFVGTDHDIRLGAAPLIQVAKTLGLPTFRASRTNELAATIHDWLAVAGPAVCEIQVEDDQDKIPRPGFTIRDAQKWIAKPLEDMFPFLDREILKENMMIDLVQDD